MYQKLITIMVLLYSSLLFSQTINATTENGKAVLLKEDGTWKYASPNSSNTEQVKFVNAKVELKRVDLTDVYNMQLTNQVRAYFQFENLTSKTLNGIQFTFTFYDSFGDELYSSEAKANIVIKAGQINPMSKYYYWEDNEFIGGEPYDKLQSATSAGTIKTKVVIQRVVFEDGSSVEY